MHRFLIGALAVAAFTIATIDAGYAVEESENNAGNTKLLGHLSDKDKPAVTETDDKSASAPAKDPTFIPVSKLGTYPNEAEPLNVDGRSRDDGVEKLRNLP